MKEAILLCHLILAIRLFGKDKITKPENRHGIFKELPGGEERMNSGAQRTLGKDFVHYCSVDTWPFPYVYPNLRMYNGRVNSDIKHRL